MYALAFSIVRNDADASEVLSESIYRAYSSLNSLKNQQAFQSWVLQIVHNTAVELVRKNSRYIDLESVSEHQAPEPAVDVHTKLALRNAVNSLDQPYRTVVTLFYYESLPVSQIALITGAAPAAVRQQLSRARKQLRDFLKEDFANA